MADLCLSPSAALSSPPASSSSSSSRLLQPLALHLLALQFLHRRRSLPFHLAHSRSSPPPSSVPHNSAHARHEAPAPRRPPSHLPTFPMAPSLRALAVALFFGGVAAFLRALLSVLPPDFLVRWRRFFSEQSRHPHSGKEKRKMGSVIYDRHGTVIATVGLVDTRRPSSSDSNVRPSDIPAFMWQAVVASEDRRFFQHHGIDPRGIARAALSLTSSGGGSTITQQLAKNLFLTNDRKWSRKLLEMFLAVLLENLMSKWDILHLYLKKIYWGHGIYGIEAASAFYFGKHPSMLGLGECAMLAGIIPAPELLSPFRDPSRGKMPQARILRRMVEAGFLDTCSAEAVVKEPLHLGSTGEQDGTPQPWRAPFFVNEVIYELKQKYGYDRVFEGGLQVHTTLDLGMQEIAEKVVRDGVFEYDNERVSLAEMDIQKICEKLEDLQKSFRCDVEKATSRILSRNAICCPFPFNQRDSIAQDASNYYS